MTGMAHHSIETIYRKIDLNAKILPAELIMITRDLCRRMDKIEGVKNERMEETPTAGQRTSKVSKKEVSPS